MKLEPAQARLLRAALRRRGPSELRRLFALIRAHDDRTLLQALAPPRRPRRVDDPLVRDLERTLRPVMGPAAEKAELLVEHLARRHRRSFAIAPVGLADAARQLRAALTDDQIRAGAASLMKRLAKQHGRETIV